MSVAFFPTRDPHSDSKHQTSCVTCFQCAVAADAEPPDNGCHSTKCLFFCQCQPIERNFVSTNLSFTWRNMAVLWIIGLVQRQLCTLFWTSLVTKQAACRSHFPSLLSTGLDRGSTRKNSNPQCPVLCSNNKGEKNTD